MGPSKFFFPMKQIFLERRYFCVVVHNVAQGELRNLDAFWMLICVKTKILSLEYNKMASELQVSEESRMRDTTQHFHLTFGAVLNL